MHTVQLLLVEADTHQEAIGIAESHLENAGWSDWSEIGGRWEGMFGDDEPTNALNYANDPEVFMKWINTFSEYRTTSIKELLAGFNKEGKTIEELVDAYDPRINNFDLGMQSYYLRRITMLISDDWNSDSSIWDVVEGTASLTGLTHRIEKEPKKQFAVIADFHF